LERKGPVRNVPYHRAANGTFSTSGCSGQTPHGCPGFRRQDHPRGHARDKEDVSSSPNLPSARSPSPRRLLGQSVGGEQTARKKALARNCPWVVNGPPRASKPAATSQWLWAGGGVDALCNRSQPAIARKMSSLGVKLTAQSQQASGLGLGARYDQETV
jgi:hypothetical protein